MTNKATGEQKRRPGAAACVSACTYTEHGGGQRLSNTFLPLGREANMTIVVSTTKERKTKGKRRSEIRGRHLSTQIPENQLSHTLHVFPAVLARGQNTSRLYRFLPSLLILGGNQRVSAASRSLGGKADMTATSTAQGRKMQGGPKGGEGIFRIKYLIPNSVRTHYMGFPSRLYQQGGRLSPVFAVFCLTI